MFFRKKPVRPQQEPDTIHILLASEANRITLENEAIRLQREEIDREMREEKEFKQIIKLIKAEAESGHRSLDIIGYNERLYFVHENEITLPPPPSIKKKLIALGYQYDFKNDRALIRW